MSLDKKRYVEPSPVVGESEIGRDPRRMDTADLKALGHPTSPMKAIRAKCLDCSGGQISEARKCTAISCPLWAFRMSKNPFYNKLKDLADADEGDDQEAESPDNAWD